MTDQQPDTRQPNTFWAEGRRRGVFRVGGLYVAGAFVILQLGEIVLPAFNAPDWALQTLVVFVFLGLPVALAFSWVYDLSPEGLKRTRSLVPAGARSLVPGLALLGVTAFSAGLGAWWFSRTAMSAPDTGAETPSSSPATFASDDPAAPITAIAVLPLAHFAEGDDLFARQLHDEIITRLSELTSLRVVSRTSVERYRTTDLLLPEIAAELRVQAIVTGSVAMTGESDSVRISIQLLHAPSDTHMESLSWQREMRDILRLQTEIAVEIATLVQGELGTRDIEVDQIAQVDHRGAPGVPAGTGGAGSRDTRGTASSPGVVRPGRRTRLGVCPGPCLEGWSPFARAGRWRLDSVRLDRKDTRGSSASGGVGGRRRRGRDRDGHP